ncbi:MAG TPA: hypothetical protein VKA53_07200, partial [Thermoanaerobaculia bacterium]|nr:hypothetical protein [Thermoanaerobaculia bacterium]
ILRPASGESRATAEAIEDPAIVSPLGHALGLAPELADALPPAFLVAGRAEAVRLARQHPGSAFIARDRAWAQAGTLHVESRQAQPGILSRQRDLAALESRLPEVEAERDELVAKREKLEEETAAVQEELRAAEAELADRRQQHAVASARRGDLAGRRQRLELERKATETELEEIEQAIERIAKRRDGLDQEVSRREAAHAELEGEFDKAQAELERAKEQREEVRTSGASRRSRLELVAERLRAHRRETERLGRELAALEAEDQRWAGEQENLGRRREELGATIERAEDELQRALEENAAGADGMREREEALSAARVELKELEGRVQKARVDLDAEREAVSELKVAQAGHKQDAEHIAQDFHEELNQAPPERTKSKEDEAEGEAEESMEVSELEEALERVKERLERLGPVNLLAAEEHDEQQERHEFLTTQREDVAKSVESLKRTIREINQTSSERFRAAFAEVNETFGRTFTQLFRGGEAEMRLLDEEDLLESGIEIVARPPGKRLQNIMLLSGGEKALTAIALLFALFRTKPSPFCILDEVDAPLDDVNTVRFVDLVKNLAADTQFIVITHNKLSMEAASLLYGVTMEEKGVSKLVSVSLDDIEEGERASA